MQVTYDKKLLIAIGRSRKAAQWQNREMLWSEFLDKLANTTRTRETVNDYAAMTKAERDNVKDVGGFVGGYLKNGRRSSASVVNRCLICLDADNADAGLLDDLDMTFINAYALYSTHSHTPEKMRLRLIVPLSRTVTPDEYAAISRRIADDLTLSRFDPTTFEPARLMYWPSTPEDGEFVFRYADQPFLDPDEVLATYRRLAGRLPLADHPAGGGEDAPHGLQAGRPADQARHHRGVLPGAQHYGHPRKHPRPTGTPPRRRTTATPSWAAAPRAGWSCTTTSTPIPITRPTRRAASCATRLILCAGICSRRAARPRTVPRGRREGLHPPDAGIRRAGRGHPPHALRGAQGAGRAGVWRSGRAGSTACQHRTRNWQEKLEVDKQGRVKDTLGNLALILRNDPRLKDIAYNIHRSGIDIRRDAEGTDHVPWTPIKPGWNESDLGALQIYLEHVYSALHAVQAQEHPAGHRRGAQLPSHPRLHRIAARVGRRAEGGHAVRGLSGRGGYGLHPRGCEEDAGGGHRARVPAGHQV